MSVRPGQAKGAFTGDSGSSGSVVTSVTATLPVVSSGGATPDISLVGLTGLGSAGQYLIVDGSGTALAWTTAGAGGVTNVTASAPLLSSGGATPNLTLNGLATLGTSLQVMAVDTAGTALEWVTCTGTGTLARSISPAFTGTGTAASWGFTGPIILGAATPGTATALQIASTVTFLTGANQFGLLSAVTFQSSATASGTAIGIGFRTAAAAFTISNGYALRVLSPILGAGSTVTNLYGIKIEDQSSTRWALKTGNGKIELGAATNSSLGFFGVNAVVQQTVTAPPASPVPNAISDNTNFQIFMTSLLTTVTQTYSSDKAYGLIS